ncbi:MAG: DUF692 domain-containing protein [Gammaproteobacteria bacterium]
MQRKFAVAGAGLGLRRTHMGPLQDHIPDEIEFLEVAPENWIGVGGRLGEAFERITCERPLACHGLLLNLGGPDPLDLEYLTRVKKFLDRHKVLIYGDHLTFCAESGQLYELLPIPFTEEAVRHLAARIRQVQDVLERTIAVENASYYLTLSTELDEITFIKAVLEEADCQLLFDVNNVYVNSVNHRYDAKSFISKIPAQRIAYAHIAGHTNEDEDLIVDTHGEPIIDPVWSLLDFAYQEFGVFPTLLERDENIPPLGEVMPEVARIKALQSRYAQSVGDAAA